MKNNCGYGVFDFDGTGMLQIEKLDSSSRFKNDAEAVEQAIKDGIKIIPVEELPHDFDEDLKYFGWVDTLENRETINNYCRKKANNMKSNKIKSFCIGDENGSIILTEDMEDFFEYLRDKIAEVEERGQEHFDITIEQTEC